MRKLQLSKIKIKQIIKLYGSGYGLRYISDIVGHTRPVIRNSLMENNIPLRTYYEAKNMDSNRKTMMEKYGVGNPMQIREFQKKQFKNALMLKEFVIDGKKFEYQGYEDRAIRILVNDRGYHVNDIDNENVPIINYIHNGNKHCYFPDIFLPKENKIIEVKSQFTYMKDYERNQSKFDKVKLDGFNFELMIL